MHSWWDRLNYGTVDVMLKVTKVSRRMHNKTKYSRYVGNCNIYLADNPRQINRSKIVVRVQHENWNGYDEIAEDAAKVFE